MRSNFVAQIQTEICLHENRSKKSRRRAARRVIPVKHLLKERGIPDHQYFWWKRKYSNQEVLEGFLPVFGGVLPAAMPTHNTGPLSKGKSRSDTTGENWMSIELRTAGGTAMRVQGGLTPAMVYTILKSL